MAKGIRKKKTVSPRRNKHANVTVRQEVKGKIEKNKSEKRPKENGNEERKKQTLA